MHQPINLIKVLKPAGHNRFAWTSHPQVPKHLRNTYVLGQRAKGVFEPSWEKKSDEQSMLYSLFIMVVGLANAFLKKHRQSKKAMNAIRALTKFYNVVLWSDEESESDATEVMLRDLTVDEYMEALLAEWGIDWQKVLKLGKQHMEIQLQIAGLKRSGDTIREQRKKKA